MAFFRKPVGRVHVDLFTTTCTRVNPEVNIRQQSREVKALIFTKNCNLGARRPESDMICKFLATVGRLPPGPGYRAFSATAPVKAASASASDCHLQFGYRTVPRAGWKLPPVGVGAFDGVTLDDSQRSENMFGGIMRGGSRLVMLNGDALAAPVDAKTRFVATHHPRRNSSWEAAALTRVLSAGRVSREQLIISATFAVKNSASLLHRVQAAAHQASINCFDVLAVSITGADASMSDSQLLETFAAAEAIIDASLARSFALHASDWHALDASAHASSPMSGTSLRRVLLLLQQHGANRQAAAAASTVLQAGASGVGKEGHRCIALVSPASLAKPDVLLPAVIDSTGRPWSIAELAERYGLSLMLTSPLDCLLPAAQFEGRFLEADPSLERPAAVPGPDERRPFRCVDAPLHLDSHPSRIASLLNDVINYAIHCELMWERDVKEAVRAEKTTAPSAASSTPALPSTSSSDLLEMPAIGAPSHKGSNSAPNHHDALRADLLGGLPPAPAAEMVLGATDSSGSGSGAAGGNDATAIMPMGEADSRPALSVDDLHPDDVAWAQMLPSRFNHPGFLTLAEWQHLRAHRLVPAMARLAEATRGASVAREWSHAYRGLLSELVNLINIHVEQTHGHRAAFLAERLEKLIAEHSAAAAPASTTGGSVSSDTSVSSPAAGFDASRNTKSKSPVAATNAPSNWGRPSSTPLQALVARLFLAFPNVFLLSEVPELHQLVTRPDARVRVEREAGKVLAALGQASGGHGNDAAPTDAAERSTDLTVAAAQRVLLSVSRSGLVLEAATRPLPEWPDSLQGIPLQVELAPIQERLRQLRAALAASSPSS